MFDWAGEASACPVLSFAFRRAYLKLALEEIGKLLVSLEFWMS
ncbi:hypothetical protein ACPOL_3997 [Acidisarcina polymorpha]|uniref:Uncharacterized protein n=1 Tax=Acidisarcina polymorpha TaxID=2211140 RepID=A0A2Z5G446_9BACT|nr:hypothetical protein ACPOL_3997 [Acidisarcina polymorpha]